MATMRLLLQVTAPPLRAHINNSLHHKGTEVNASHTACIASTSLVTGTVTKPASAWWGSMRVRTNARMKNCSQLPPTRLPLPSNIHIANHIVALHHRHRVSTVPIKIEERDEKRKMKAKILHHHTTSSLFTHQLSLKRSDLKHLSFNNYTIYIQQLLLQSATNHSKNQGASSLPG